MDGGIVRTYRPAASAFLPSASDTGTALGAAVVAHVEIVCWVLILLLLVLFFAGDEGQLFSMEGQMVSQMGEGLTVLTVWRVALKGHRTIRL